MNVKGETKKPKDKKPESSLKLSSAAFSLADSHRAPQKLPTVLSREDVNSDSIFPEEGEPHALFPSKDSG